MKLLLYLGFMVIALAASFSAGKYILKATKKLSLSLLSVLFSSAIILSFASCWWLLTEDDGISQGLGILYYTIAFFIINLMNMIICFKSRTQNQ
jgi:hypothetical protein